MVDLLITKKTIAIIYQEGNYWKIAFGVSRKKILPDKYNSFEESVRKAKGLGFGGWIRVSKHANLNAILNKKTKWSFSPDMFSGEKGWRSIYKNRHANT